MRDYKKQEQTYKSSSSDIEEKMKRYYILFLLFSLSSCKKPLTSRDCQMTFAREMFKAVEYQECHKEELKADFKKYQEWIGFLASPLT